MKIVNTLKSQINTLGYDLKRFPSLSLRNRIKLLNSRDINLIFDVGANVGQYVEQIRKSGYKGKIVSFEPIKTAFEKIQIKSKQDKNWKAVHSALGDFDGESSINVSGNLASSSIRTIRKLHTDLLSSTATVRTETIEVAKVDTIIDNYVTDNDKLFVKIDTQGFEKNVIDGALNSLDKILGFQLELSLVEMYDGETLFLDMIDHLKSFGYSIYSLEPGYYNLETGQMYQVDAIFFK